MRPRAKGVHARGGLRCDTFGGVLRVRAGSVVVRVRDGVGISADSAGEVSGPLASTVMAS